MPKIHPLMAAFFIIGSITGILTMAGIYHQNRIKKLTIKRLEKEVGER